FPTSSAETIEGAPTNSNNTDSSCGIVIPFSTRMESNAYCEYWRSPSKTSHSSTRSCFLFTANDTTAFTKYTMSLGLLSMRDVKYWRVGMPRTCGQKYLRHITDGSLPSP